MILLIAMALGLASPQTGYGTTDFDPMVNGNPPKRYQADNTVTVTFTSEHNIAVACDDPNSTVMIGCGTVGQPQIWIGNPCGINESYAKTLCHELAHTNGWPADHPR